MEQNKLEHEHLEEFLPNTSERNDVKLIGTDWGISLLSRGNDSFLLSTSSFYEEYGLSAEEMLKMGLDNNMAMPLTQKEADRAKKEIFEAQGNRSSETPFIRFKAGCIHVEVARRELRMAFDRKKQFEEGDADVKKKIGCEVFGSNWGNRKRTEEELRADFNDVYGKLVEATEFANNKVRFEYEGLVYEKYNLLKADIRYLLGENDVAEKPELGVIADDLKMVEADEKS